MFLRFFFSLRFCFFSANTSMPFYAVRIGRNPGIYNTWDECSVQVKGFPNAMHKKFKNEEEAAQFIQNGNFKRKAFEGDNLAKKTLKSSICLDYSSKHIAESCVSSCLPDIVEIEVPQSTACKGSFYAVHRGKKRGVYRTWSECELQIKDFKHPSYRKFETEEEALEFVKTGGIKKLGRREAKHVKINNDFANECKDSENEYTLDDVKVKSSNYVTVFTDGASSKNGRVGAAAGIGVYWGPNHPLNTSMRLPGRQTNNRAEIYAAIHALRQARTVGATNIKLYTDSQFLIHGITDWIKKWKKNNWKLANGEPVKNKEDFIELDKARQGLNVEFIYIKAHDNNPGNVEADRLAVAGARKALDDTFVCLA